MNDNILPSPPSLIRRTNSSSSNIYSNPSTNSNTAPPGFGQPLPPGVQRPNGVMKSVRFLGQPSPAPSAIPAMGISVQPGGKRRRRRATKKRRNSRRRRTRRHR
jgi:hypothetical protein